MRRFTGISLFLTGAHAILPACEVPVRYCFEDFVLDAARHELRRNGVILPAAPQVLDLLIFLIQQRGRVVTKDQIIATVWEGRAIADSALTTRLNVARSVLGDSGREQRLIKTLPRKGFRFTGEVREEPTPALPGEHVLRGLPSIAVLPFTNFSGDPSQDFFGNVIAEDVLTELARLRWLLVIGRNSSFAFTERTADAREIGRQLRVGYVLEGSAQHSNGRARVTARLVDTQTALQVWSARYERHFADVFDAQTEITDAVVAALVPAIVGAERKRIVRQMPGTLSVWESYQRGVWHMLRHSADDNQQARRFFQQAIAREADYSPGHDGLAWTHLMDATAFGRITIAEGCRRSELLARRAVELDPENAEARARLALSSYMSGDSRTAMSEADQALTISPNCPDAHGVRGVVLVFSGEHRNGRTSLERYLRLNPRDPARPIRLSQIAASYYLERDYRGAARVARQTVQQFPGVHFAYRWLAASLGQLGEHAEGAKVIAEFTRRCASSVDSYLSRRPPPRYRRDDYEHMMEGLAKAGWRG